CVAQQSVSYLPRRPVTVINRLDAQPIAPADLRVPLPNPEATVRVINLQAGLLATTCTVEPAPGRNGQITADLDRDLLKIVVLCRYQPHAQPAIGLIRDSN
ncbi:MAG: adenine deaminase, partial [Kiritimatiellae bacterium]|nr:adenine deaminase [Kiritimatiellia bacterium]